MGKNHLQVRQSSRQFSTNYLIFCGISFKKLEKYMTNTRPATQSHTLTPQQNGGTSSIRDLVKGCVCVPVVDKHRHRVLLNGLYHVVLYEKRASLKCSWNCWLSLFFAHQKNPTKKKTLRKKGSSLGKKKNLQRDHSALPKLRCKSKRGSLWGNFPP